MATGLAGKGHRALLVVWSYLPFWVRKAAIRILYPQFPVGAVAVIRDADGRVLLVRQTYHRREMWGAPGGWVGRGETPRQAAARETFEEVGLKVSVGRVLAQDGGPYGEVSLAFECRLADEHAVQFNGEIDRAAYFPPDRLPPLPRDTRRLLRDALASLAHPAEEDARRVRGRR
jgi:ADP-ribose pyrophosphatase YjhB (NUDIX family)